MLFIAKRRREDGSRHEGQPTVMMGACAAAPPDDIQEIGQGGFTVWRGTGLACKAQAVAHPLAAARQLQRPCKVLRARAGTSPPVSSNR